MDIALFKHPVFLAGCTYTAFSEGILLYKAGGFDPQFGRQKSTWNYGNIYLQARSLTPLSKALFLLATTAVSAAAFAGSLTLTKSFSAKIARTGFKILFGIFQFALGLVLREGALRLTVPFVGPFCHDYINPIDPFKHP